MRRMRDQYNFPKASEPQAASSSGTKLQPEKSRRLANLVAGNRGRLQNLVGPPQKGPQDTRRMLGHTSNNNAPAGNSSNNDTIGSSNSKPPAQKITPELAKCYDEIDQIYDYIRGLAPLPIQLRKIKSIDFEQLELREREREKLIQLQQQQQQQQQQAKAPSVSPATAARSAKARQRDASESLNENLKRPAQVHQKSTVVKANYIARPVVKRVESLNLGPNQPAKKPAEPAEQRLQVLEQSPARPNYLISASTRFRLPRAHSTSNLNQQKQQQVTICKNISTLPTLKSTSRQNVADYHGASWPDQSMSLNRVQKPTKAADLIESYVDDDDDDDDEEDGAQATTCSSSAGSNRQTTNDLKSHSDYENETVSSSSSSSTSSSASSSSASDSPSSSSALSSKAKRTKHRRNSSSGNGTANENQNDGDEEGDKVEHIYEQIPAHKNPSPRQQVISSSSSSSRQHLNYPVAFAPNVAMISQQQRVPPYNSLTSSSTNRIATQHRQPPPPPVLSRPMLALDHRHRLSMNNLNLLPYIGHQPQMFAHRPASKSSSKTKLLQMPRISSSLAKYSSQFSPAMALQHQQQSTSSKQSSNRAAVNRQPIFLWPPTTDQIRQQQYHQTVLMNQQQPHRSSRRRLTAIGIENEALADCIRSHQIKSLQVAPPNRHQSRIDSNQKPARGYFEPPQLMKAPLIDVEGSSDDEADKQPSKKQQEASNRLNSISDLHSFSSTSNDDSERSSSHKDTNFVSSRSFIKCYYGKENQLPTADNKQERREKHQPEVVEGHQRQQQQVKKKSSDKLLGLIGLQSAGREKQQAPKRIQKSPIKAMFVAAQQPTSKKLSEAAILNSEGPILVCDRRLQQANLVRHYEHPIVQVAKVPSSSKPSRAHLLHQDASLADPLHQRFLNMLEKHQAGSTDTTNSTSSYEAAIKNNSLIESPAERQSPSAAPQVTLQRKARSQKPASSSSQQPSQLCIKVPKLSKQSHLLNRPLPKPPSGLSQANYSSNSLSSSTQQQQRRSSATIVMASQAARLANPTGAGSSRPAVATAKKSPISTNLDASQPSNRAKQSANKEQSNLSPLNVSIQSGSHHSPTVTTCTSSGISSRLTSGTQHLSSSARSSLQNRARPQKASSGSGAQPSAQQDRKQQFINDDNFALMDADSSSEESEQSEPESEADEAPRTESRRLGSLGSQRQQQQQQQQQQQHRQKVGSNLRLFDEKFSSRFLDNQLASSSDSLLESISKARGRTTRSKQQL